ncbi:mechanosensitive ion channel family protein [Methanosphaera sp.]
MGFLEIIQLILGTVGITFDDVDTLLSLIVVIVVPLLILEGISLAIKRINKTSSFDFKSLRTLSIIIRAIAICIIFFGVLEVLGISFRSLFVSLGLVTVAVSLAAQDLLSNIMSGIMLYIDRKFEVGDVLEIDGQLGKVTKIGFRYVELFKCNKLTIVPNKLFTTKNFVNYTKTGFYLMYVTIKLPNDDDLDNKLKILSQIIEENEHIVDRNEYRVLIKGMSAFGVEILLKLPLDDALRDDDIVSEILGEFRKSVDFDYGF